MSLQLQKYTLTDSFDSELLRVGWEGEINRDWRIMNDDEKGNTGIDLDVWCGMVWCGVVWCGEGGGEVLCLGYI